MKCKSAFLHFVGFFGLLIVRNSCACLNDSEKKTLQIRRAGADSAELELKFAGISGGKWLC
jgi:hypothetical protein